MTVKIKTQDDAERCPHVSMTLPSNANDRVPALGSYAETARRPPMTQGLFGGVVGRGRCGSATWRSMASQ